MQTELWAGLGIFAATSICLEGGYRLGRFDQRHGREPAPSGGAIEAGVLGLLGLLLGFGFGGGASRFEFRRQLIVQEANAIGTAYLRLDLLDAAARTDLQQLFRDYLDQRLFIYQSIQDMPTVRAALDRAGTMQKVIWSRGVAASRADQTQIAPRLLLPALNEMIDITTTRTVMLFAHLPPLIFCLLASVAMLSGLLAGYGMASRRGRNWIHMLVYPVVVGITFYAIIDLDYPRRGLIRLDVADNALRELRQSMR